MGKIRLGFAMCGSFCTFQKVLFEMQNLVKEGYDVFPILSETAYSTDTRFGKAVDFQKQIEEMTGHPIVHTIFGAEPIGPKKLLDVLLLAPTTGNTLGKLANGITDSAVTLAFKAHLRNERPVVLAVSTNDALSASAKNIGTLLNTRHVFFVPMRQDAPKSKPRSVVADFGKISESVKAALMGQQVQPIFCTPNS